MPDLTINKLPLSNVAPNTGPQASKDPAASNVSAIAQAKIKDPSEGWHHLTVFIPDDSGEEGIKTSRYVPSTDDDPPPYSPTGYNL